MVKGYWRGDGTYSEKAFSFVSMSERLCREMQVVLLRLNALCGIFSVQNKYGMVFTGRIPIQHTKRFSQIVGYDVGDVVEGKHAPKSLRETKTHFLVRVRKTEKYLHEGEVFNLRVSGKSSYTANGVGVHNCMEAKAQLGIKIMVDTAIECRHVGLAEATYGSFTPCNTTPVT